MSKSLIIDNYLTGICKRSSHGHFVKASGLRWLSLMLTPIPWANHI